MTTFEFEVDGGKDYPKGKPTWPSMIRIYMPKDDALDFVCSAAKQVRLRKDGDVVEFVLFGSIKETTGEDE